MKSINDKLEAIDKEYDDTCKAIDDQAEFDKETLGTKMVDGFLKKII